MKCSLTFGNNDLVAQLVEQRTFNAWAMGSSPIGVTQYRCGGMVDTNALGAFAIWCEGSSPFIGTKCSIHIPTISQLKAVVGLNG